MTRWFIRFVRWLLDREPCVVPGCERAAGAKGTCDRHVIDHLGAVHELSKDGLTDTRLPGRPA